MKRESSNFCDIYVRQIITIDRRVSFRGNRNPRMCIFWIYGLFIKKQSRLYVRIVQKLDIPTLLLFIVQSDILVNVFIFHDIFL
jgi:hypothetical protein